MALQDTYAFLGHRDPSDPLVRAYAPKWRPGARLDGPTWLSVRNKSILAHGFKSIGEDQWSEANRWVEDTLRPFWSVLEPPQLPTHLPEAPSPQLGA